MLTAHSLAETYAVLTRLPGGARVAAPDAERLLSAGFADVLVPAAETVRELPIVLAGAGICGGATYDALVALAARDHATPLATRDARAMGTYAALGVTARVLPS